MSRPKTNLNPIQAVDTLEDLLRTKYALVHNEGQLPVLVHGSISDAISLAKQRFKFLFVYLHSDQHPDAAKFCTEVFSSNGVVDFLNDNFVVWAGDISNEDGYAVANVLKAGTYPFMAVLCHYGVSTQINPIMRVPGLGGGIMLCDRINGLISSGDLIARLTTSLETFEPIITAARAEQTQRAAEQRLRAEQDNAFQQSLAADREKERKRREEEDRRRREQEEAARIEAEERARQEREILMEQELRHRREQKARSLPAEPVASDPEPTTLLAIRIGSAGERLQRRFYQSDSIDLVYDFVESKEEEIPHDRLEIVTHFPKKKFERGSGSLKELGLTPQAQIFVQERFEI